MNSNESRVKTKLILAKKLHFNHEKLSKLELFVSELLKFNKKYNLISKGSEKNIWNRHVLDSAQLIDFIDQKKYKSLSDLGTGGGFPGIVLGIFYSDNITFHVKLFEKSNVKIKFIQSIKSKLKLKNVLIYENDYQSHIIDTDYVICRAFKKLPEIIKISREIKNSHKLIVMMGKSAQDQINKASKGMIYKYKLISSITQSDSKILLVDVKK